MLEKDHERLNQAIKDLGTDMLERTNLLHNIVKESLISETIDSIILSDQEVKEIIQNFMLSAKINDEKDLENFLDNNNISRNRLESKLIRSNKIIKYYLYTFNPKAKEYFENNKNSFNKVTYAMIRTKDNGLARELYLQIESGEGNIYDLASQYSEGEEKHSKGIIGPVPIIQSHKILRKYISNSKEGDLIEPFKIEDWWIILKIERLLYPSYSKNIETDICKNYFEEELEKRINSMIKELKLSE